MTVETVPAVQGRECEITVTISPFCPIKNEVDRYDVTIRWDTDGGETFEKWALEKHIKSYTGSEITQEKLTYKLKETLSNTEVSAVSVELQDVKHMDMVTVA